MVVSYGATPKFLVYIGKSYKDRLSGGTPILGNLQTTDKPFLDIFHGFIHRRRQQTIVLSNSTRISSNWGWFIRPISGRIGKVL